ncbi:MAG: CrcB family protein, partial [Candidatus Eremiobacteraeota bacterium]|nr:CrcB family protein [Candidatus Eremiobacteraeota bacterium]
MSVQALVAVALGGAAGSVLRYIVGFAFAQQFGSGFPWGTLFINVTGSFVIGLVWQFSLASSIGMSPFMRVLLMAGVLGGYTT